MNVKRTKQCLFRSFLFFSGLLIAMVTSAQQFTVRGTVKDATGEPVIGANVMVKGTSNGTITDIDGKYSFRTLIHHLYLCLPLSGIRMKRWLVKDSMKSM